MFLGIVAPFGFEDFETVRFLELYKSVGVGTIQAYRNPDAGITPADVVRVSRLLDLKVDSMHGLFGDEIDPSSPDEKTRLASIEVYRSETDWCREIGGKGIVVHPTPDLRNGPYVSAEIADVRAEQFQKTLDSLARIAESAGVVFLIENMPPSGMFAADLPRLADMVRSRQTPHLGFCLDAGHLLLTKMPYESVKACKGILGGVHAHDNDGVEDIHLLPFRGKVDWDSLFEVLHSIGYDGLMTLEVFEPMADLPGLLTPVWKKRMDSLLTNNRKA
jgi:sugar phosphate isomerase/epimerase